MSFNRRPGDDLCSEEAARGLGRFIEELYDDVSDNEPF
jgi:hypothetical protein